MSRLSNAINVYQSKDRYSEFRPLKMFSCADEITNLVYENGTKYRLQAVFGTEALISNAVIQQSETDVMAEVLRNTRRQIAEEIFGEFREPLLTIQRNAYINGDKDSASLVSDILDSMFKV